MLPDCNCICHVLRNKTQIDELRNCYENHILHPYPPLPPLNPIPSCLCIIFLGNESSKKVHNNHLFSCNKDDGQHKFCKVYNSVTSIVKKNKRIKKQGQIWFPLFHSCLLQWANIKKKNFSPHHSN